MCVCVCVCVWCLFVCFCLLVGFWLAAPATFLPVRQRYVSGQKPNMLPIELSVRPKSFIIKDDVAVRAAGGLVIIFQLQNFSNRVIGIINLEEKKNVFFSKFYRRQHELASKFNIGLI